MFKDVISTGWWRIHLIIFTVAFVPPPLILIIGYLIDNFRDSFATAVIWLGISLAYFIIFRTVVWVKRGFKKS